MFMLCTHSKYQTTLREEAQQASKKQYNERINNLPLLDSFLRESARLNPLDARKFGNW